MKKQTKSRIVSILLVLIFLSGLIYFISYVFWMSETVRYPFGLGLYSEIGRYEINPEIILASLDRGKTDVFIPSTVFHENTYRLFSTGSFPWRQSDYLKISNAVFQYGWEEKLDDWYLFDMFFIRSCQNNPNGFDGGEITFFRPISNGSSYETRLIIISPLWGEIEWGRDAFYPHPPLFGWKSIDLDKLNLTADDVLQIAEESGGREARLKIKNACNIKVILSPNTDSGYVWRVYYSPNYPYYDTETFEIHINPNKFR